jgi:hypothetical protein
MTTHIEHEMANHLEEIERIHANMLKLQETKKKQETEQENKTNNTEPNMAVMDNWLHTHKYNEEQKVLSKSAEKKYNDYHVRGGGRNLQENPLTEEEEEERNKVMDNYRKYCLRKHSRYGESIEHPKKKMDTFHQGDRPSQFMIDFIEATHNLFQIQQKRIDELENIVAQNQTRDANV